MDHGSPVTSTANNNLAEMMKPTQPEPINEEKKQTLFQKWEAFFQRPEIQAAAIQFGARMLQPMAPGQNFTGQFGQAITEGAGAAGRVGAIQHQQQVEQQQLGLEERRTAATESQAATAREGLNVQREGLDIRREQVQADIDIAEKNYQVALGQLGLARQKHKDDQNYADIELASQRQTAILNAINTYNKAGADAALSTGADFTPIPIDPTQFSDAEMLKSAQTFRTFREAGTRPDTMDEATAKAIDNIKNKTPQQLADQLQEVPPEQWTEVLKRFGDAGGSELVVAEALKLLQPAATGTTAQGGGPGAPAPAAQPTPSSPLAETAKAAITASDAAAQSVTTNQINPFRPPESIPEGRQNIQASKAEATQALDNFKNSLPNTLDEVPQDVFDILKNSPALQEILTAKFGADAMNQLYQKFQPEQTVPTIQR